MFTETEKAEIAQYLTEMPENSAVYIGCDSVKYKKRGQWFARYNVAFIIHIASRHGGRIFHFSEVERDYDPKKEKPRMRLMNEVYKAVGTYLEFAEQLEDLPVEIHIDINPDENHNSSVVLREALGYVKGMTGLDAVAKPDGWAASHAGDRGARGKFTH
jgi:predicted RNase H-related nuclease YkuK (DUF458 family)